MMVLADIYRGLVIDDGSPAANNGGLAIDVSRVIRRRGLVAAMQLYIVQ